MSKIVSFFVFISLCFNTLANYYKFPADTSFHFATKNEGSFPTNSNYLDREVLESFPKKFDNWTSEDLPLQMDLVFHRYYEYRTDKESETRSLYLLIAHGSNESDFHAAEVCYFGKEWQMEDRAIKTIKIADNKFPIRYSVANKEGYQRVLMYWYIWPDHHRRITRGMTMFRLAIDVDNSVSDAVDVGMKFIQYISDVKIGDQKKLPAYIKLKEQLPVKFKKDHLSQAIKKAYTWLLSQMTPNDIVPNPVSPRRNLILSYIANPESPAFPYIFSKSSLYDNALAVIAFSMLGDFENAQKVIDGVWRSQSESGKHWFAVNTHNLWPNDKDESGSIVRNGATAWFGYAVVFYLNQRKSFDKAYAETSEAKSNTYFLKKMTDYIIDRQITDKKDNRYGLITGGEGSYYIAKNKTTGKPEELYRKGNIEWNSIEHNIDSYYLLRDLGLYLNEKKYLNSANLLKSSLVKKSWNKELKQFNRGHNKNGGDPVEALDTASWGAMLLNSIGEKKLATIALKKADQYYTTHGKFKGHKPYRNFLVYEDLDINKIFYPKNPKKDWNDIPIVWFEGTYGVIMAKIKLGKIKEAMRDTKNTLLAQGNDGALPYATNEIEFQFTTAPSVASTAWFIMVGRALQDRKMRAAFWSKD